MRSFLAWLMIIGVMAGVMARAVPHPSHTDAAFCSDARCEMIVEDCAIVADCCAGDSGHSHEQEPQDETKAPEHHHHHLCCATMPVIVDAEKTVAFIGLHGVRTRVSLEQHDAPESPVYELDKPPLI